MNDGGRLTCNTLCSLPPFPGTEENIQNGLQDTCHPMNEAIHSLPLYILYRKSQIIKAFKLCCHN